MNLSFFQWWKRYKVRAQDMNDFQEALNNQTRVLAQGTFEGAVIKGMDITASTGMTFSVEAGIAVSPTGYANVKEASENVTPTAPGSNLKRSLLVVRPKLVEEEVITKPTAPFETVYLRTKQDCELVIIDGTPSATPAYPSKLAEDTIVCGLRLYTGQTVITDDDIDYSVRETPGNNGNLGQRTGLNDDRLRPYRASATTVGIKPSQKTGSGKRSFLATHKGNPSIYPKDGSGLFANSDSILNFVNGQITGGDSLSPDFTVVSISGANSRVATVVINVNDTIQVFYGTEGTRAQCLSAIKNQVRGSSAGNLHHAPQGYKVAYVLLSAISGTLADLEVIDVRGNQLSGSLTKSVANNTSVDLDEFGYFRTTDLKAMEFFYTCLRRTNTDLQVQSGRVYCTWDSENSVWLVTKNAFHDYNDGLAFSISATGGSNEFKLVVTSSNMSGSSYSGSLTINNLNLTKV